MILDRPGHRLHPVLFGSAARFLTGLEPYQPGSPRQQAFWQVTRRNSIFQSTNETQRQDEGVQPRSRRKKGSARCCFSRQEAKIEQQEPLTYFEQVVVGRSFNQHLHRRIYYSPVFQETILQTARPPPAETKEEPCQTCRPAPPPKCVRLPVVRARIPQEQKIDYWQELNKVGQSYNHEGEGKDVGDKLEGVTAQAFCLLDLGSREVVLSRNKDERLEMASLTKVMTCICVLLICQKHGKGLNSKVRVSEECAAVEGTSAGIRAGEVYSVEELLYGLMLPSGNDAASALAGYCGKLAYRKRENNQEEQPRTRKFVLQFIQLMNKLGRGMRLSNTHFASVHGLNNEFNYSSARDLAVLCAGGMRLPQFRKVVMAQEYSCNVYNEKSGLVRVVKWENLNRLLDGKSCLGVKTGHTSSAGSCFAGYFLTEGRELVTVVLNSRGRKQRFRDTQTLVVRACDEFR